MMNPVLAIHYLRKYSPETSNSSAKRLGEARMGGDEGLDWTIGKNDDASEEGQQQGRRLFLVNFCDSGYMLPRSRPCCIYGYAF